MKELKWVVFGCKTCKSGMEVTALAVDIDCEVHFQGYCIKCDKVITMSISIQKLIDMAVKKMEHGNGIEKDGLLL